MGLFDQLAEIGNETKEEKRRRRGSLTLPVSIAVHVAVLAAVILVPLFFWEDMPEPTEMAVHAFFVEPAPAAPPPPPPPPPAHAAMQTPRPKALKAPQVPQVPTTVPKFTAPVENAPKSEPAVADPGPATSEPEAADAGGEPGGMEGGVTGGVQGGTPGGVVGGTLGGTPGGEVGGVPGGEGQGHGDAPDGPVRVGGQIKAPHKLKNVDPAYPTLARNARVKGVVIIEATIDESGRVTNARVLRGVPMLDQSALEAVRQWVYSPTMLNGQAVSVIMTVTVNFNLGS